MKISVVSLVFAAVLLTGCASPLARMNSAVDSMEQAVQSVGNALETAAMGQPAATETTSGPLTKAQAEAIALAHAGFTAGQVTRLRTEYEVDDGIPRFEVKFRQGRWEYDYEINADTGAILSYDRDD